MIKKLCSICGSAYHYKTFCPYKKRKPIPQKGHRARVYEGWRDTVAKPYLDKKFGRVCAVKGCSMTEGLEVDHIKTRGARPDLKMALGNVRYLCHEHHRLVTDGKLKL